jgi:nitronate monooxygenase
VSTIHTSVGNPTSTMSGPTAIRTLQSTYKFLKTPIIVSAPMRVFAGPDLAVATSRAGGFGFIGPGVKPADLDSKLEKVRALLDHKPIPDSQSSFAQTLPIGVGFQLFDGDINVATAAVRKHKPAAAWLFVPKTGQMELDEWSARLREASPSTRIWIQVGSVAEAVAAAQSLHSPDALVIQGVDAGGHGLRRGAGVVSLLPEVADALRDIGKEAIPLFGAGGIADGRGVAAVLGTGVAAGVVMGTRFLASNEAEIKPGYQNDVLRVSDGGQNTVRTDLFDRLQGRDDWPARYDGRAIINASVRDDLSGLDFQKSKAIFQAQQKDGTLGWGDDGRMTAYVGSAVGIIKGVESAKDIVESARRGAREALRHAAEGLD